MTKKILLTVAAVVGLLLVAAIALPFVIDADRFRPTMEEKLNVLLGRQVRIGHVDLSILKGDLKASDISLAEDRAFGSAPFVRAKSLEVGIDLVPLILSHVVHVRSLTFDEPQVVLLRSSSGKWNFSSLGQGESHGKAQPATPSSAETPAFTVEKLKISGGRLTVGGSSRSRQTYDHVNLTAENLSYESAFPFTLAAQTPGGGVLRVNGNAGPLDQKDAAQTPFQAKVALQRFDLTSTGFLDPSSGLAGLVDYSGEARSTGKILHTDGTAKVDKLRLVRGGSSAGQPVSVRYATDYNLATQAGKLTKGEILTGKSTVALSGTYETHGDSTAVHMKLAAPSVPVEDIKALLPAVGVTLPSGSTLQGGTASANLSLDGPVESLVTSGDVNLSNAKLSGFGLGQKLAALSLFTGLKASPDTVIETMSSGLRISPDGIRSEALKLVVADIGTITGAGTIGANGALDFKLMANLATTGAGAALANLASRTVMGGAIAKGIPILVHGTTSNPVFVPDTSALIQGGVLNQQGATGATPPKNLGDVLGGIFGRKKQQ
jgi:AsmA protein